MVQHSDPVSKVSQLQLVCGRKPWKDRLLDQMAWEGLYFCTLLYYTMLYYYYDYDGLSCSLTMYASRESLIDVTIETAVSRMQTVVELGRVIRDRRTLPMKVPIPTGSDSVPRSKERKRN